MSDITEQLRQQIATARNAQQAIRIEGSNTKAFLGTPSKDETISTREHHGIVSYDPSELVITVRSGTTIKTINDTLAESKQMLPFEPPSFNEQATIGGTIACNLSGPARPYAGAARDFVLGSKIINGNAEPMQFGGQVMKNVAGYDASRLMAGAYGTLGLITEVSLKVLPEPATEITLVIETGDHKAIEIMNQLAGRNIPLTASCFYEDKLYLRLQGSENNTQSIATHLQKEFSANRVEEGGKFWLQVREQQHDFFNSPAPLWRLSLPPVCTNLSLPGTQFIEWGGAQRWLISNAEENQIRQAVSAAGGHATAYKNYDDVKSVFQPLNKVQLKLHRRLKHAFDPENILNPGRMYSEL